MSDKFDIEDLFKEGFSDHQEQPSEDLYAKIESSAESREGIVARYRRAFKEWEVHPSKELYQKIALHYWFKKLFVPTLLSLAVVAGSTFYLLNIDGKATKGSKKLDSSLVKSGVNETTENKEDERPLFSSSSLLSNEERKEDNASSEHKTNDFKNRSNSKHQQKKEGNSSSNAEKKLLLNEKITPPHLALTLVQLNLIDPDFKMDFTLQNETVNAVELPKEKQAKTSQLYLLGGANTLRLKKHHVPDFSTESKTGYHLGLGWGKSFLNDRLLTRVELSYSKNSYTMIYNTPTGILQNLIWDHQQIYLPIKLAFRALKYNQFSLLLGAGGAAQFTNYLQPSIQITEADGTPYFDPIPYGDSNTDYRRWDFSLQGEVAVQYQHEKFFIEPYFTFYPNRVFALHSDESLSGIDAGPFSKKWYTFSEMQWGLKIGF